MRAISLTIAVILFTISVQAQQKDSVAASDYSRAEKFLYPNTLQYIDHGNVWPHWTGGNTFWYRSSSAQGSEFIIVDPVKGTRTPAFDHQKLAAALSAASGKQYTVLMLPIRDLVYTADGGSILFPANGRQWKADLKTYAVVEQANQPSPQPRKEDEVLSPDGKKAAFIKDYNLWVRDIGDNKLTQLTTDGVEYFGYATDNAGWEQSNAPVLSWSHDSKKIATFQQDERKVGNMYLVTTTVGHPELKAWKYPLAGDSNIATIQRLIIDVDVPKVIRLQIAPDPHRGSLIDDISNNGLLGDVAWSDDDHQLAFVSTSRDHKIEKFRMADAATGAVREVFEEKVNTQYESGQGDINWRYLSASNEIIWYSERDNWGHLYLYDATSGNLKKQITKGNWVVTRLIHVDEKKRVLYFLADGKEPGNPYFTHFYKIGMDGKNLTVLSPEPGIHDVKLSPDFNYFLDDYSQPDVPNVTVLRNMDGKIISTLEKKDISRLTANGWVAPKLFTVKAHDGQTDLYGFLFAPSHVDASKKYPVVVHIYPGPQGGSINTYDGWWFMPARDDDQALAELGFVVIEIEGTANPLRSKSYHDMNYGNMAENTLPDQVAGVRQLAEQYHYLDTNRVGIWGHSGGGFATACAMFKYPDFFKVGISESGNHDNREYEDDWGERYIGLLTKDSNGVSNYEIQANQLYAKNLKGKLLLAHGLMDDNVPPYNTWLVVRALEMANKDYDLIVFPDGHHGYGYNNSTYMMRRRWDYFVKNLMGAQPPKEYAIKYNFDPRNMVK